MNNLRFGKGGGVEPSLLLLLLWIPWMLISEVGGIRVDLYLNKDKFGEFLKMDISEKGCTNVPLNWDNQAYSLETHGSCVKFYDLPYCRGKYVALQPYHTTFQDNLETLGFKHLISSASPCGPKVPTGRYYILNGADGSVLTIDQRNGTVVSRTKPFKPFITKNQQFQIDKISLADYEIIPRVHEGLNPLTFDMSLSTKQYPVRRTWKIESVYRGKYLIKNEWNNKCLYKTDIGKVEEHDCVPWSPNQEWMFKSIKIQPFFPSKAQLTKNPVIKPDAQFPFDPQEEVNPFAAGGIPHPPRPQPGQPLEAPPVKYLKNQQKKKKKDNDDSEEDDEDDDDSEEDEEDVPNKANQISKPHTRPNPIVLNPREPFPPVQPHPIYPKGTQFLPPIGKNGKPDFSKPPVPVVRHPGQGPFPREPVVTDPKKPVWPPTLFGSFGPTPPTTTKATPVKKKNVEDEDEDGEDGEENEKDDAGEEEEEETEDREADEREEEAEEYEGDGDERGSLERGQGQSYEREGGQSYERGDEEEEQEEE